MAFMFLCLFVHCYLYMECLSMRGIFYDKYINNFIFLFAKASMPWAVRDLKATTRIIKITPTYKSPQTILWEEIKPQCTQNGLLISQAFMALQKPKQRRTGFPGKAHPQSACRERPLSQRRDPWQSLSFQSHWVDRFNPRRRPCMFLGPGTWMAIQVTISSLNYIWKLIDSQCNSWNRQE